MNLYAKTLKEQGCNVIEEDSVFWYEYQGFMTPAYLPHCTPLINRESVIKVLKKTKKPFVRWDTDFGKIEKSEWWYVLKRDRWNIDDVKDKKKRWMIKQGIKNFTTRVLTYNEAVSLCPEVALKAAKRYQGKSIIETEDILVKRTNAAKKVPDVLEYIGCFEGEKLVSFSENYIQDNAVWLAIIRHDPEYLKHYSSYGMMNGILEYYLNEKKFKYVLDGSRSIHHKTEFQEHLMKIFGFTKEYAKLNIVYSPVFKMIVNVAYYSKGFFWWLSEKTESNFIANISAVLKQ
ncbi:MAG: hypothetical protein PHQ00_01630, partial [Phycisphaerae bacterium]|nr:hypothetical protein [Phycisphaerae bacterium]